MRMRKVTLIALLLCLMTGCALVRQITGLNSKQLATWMMNVFTMELQKLQAEGRMYWAPFTTDEQRLVMRWKMALLRKAHPLIASYADAAEAGVEPSLQIENMIVDLLNLVIQGGPVPDGAELVDEPPRPANSGPQV